MCCFDKLEKVKLWDYEWDNICKILGTPKEQGTR